ncbi:UNVERIFIED_CONTAM: hypothetical protein GTU68_029816 [Idotea baltica]|nr:hypothetical protein [Idotea baltica]
MKMFRKLTLTAAVALGLASGAAHAAGDAHVEDFDFSFEGPFGSYDTNQLQRGLQVYTEICSSCHGLKFVAYRNLSDEGGPMLPDDQMRAYAEQYEVFDQALFDGEGDFRPATPADNFGESSQSNAPDLSLMAKARAGFHGPYGLGINQFFKGMGGPEYIASLLTGYEDEPECAANMEIPMDGYYNTAFAGSWIAMAPPLWEEGGQFEFADGHSSSLEDVAMDVSAFLMWTAEPKMVARKQAGLTGVIFLTVLSVLLYLTNKRLWAPHKAAAKRKD